MTKKILIVATNCSKINDDIPTGIWLEEFAVPFIVFKSTGYEVLVSSPNGGNIPIDENSLSCSNPMEWDEAAKYLKNTIKLCDSNYRNFDALYIPGGHGPMFDLASDLILKNVVEYMFENNRIISALCHGPAGLIMAKDKDGNSILKNKHVTCFTNKEEHIGKLDQFLPFLLEDKLRRLGTDFIEDKPWSEHVEISGNIITGQNQQSSLLLAESVISLL